MHTHWVQIQVNTPRCRVIHCPAAELNLIQCDVGGTMPQLSILYQDALSCKILQRAYLKALILPQNLPRQCIEAVYCLQTWYRHQLVLASVPLCPLLTIYEKSSKGRRAIGGESSKCHQSMLSSLQLFYENGLAGSGGVEGMEDASRGWGEKGILWLYATTPKRLN